jgi:RsiW-degrading membrane proteinase PrsW (M82 family)
MRINHSRIHHLTRDAGFLWRVCGGIIAAGLVLAGIIHSLRPDDGSNSSGSVMSYPKEWQKLMKSQAGDLASSAKPQPAELAAWLGELGHGMKLNAPDWKFDAVTWRIHNLELAPLLQKNTESDFQRELFSDYALSLFLEKGEARSHALVRVHDAALREPMVQYASGFDGDLLVIEGKRKEALVSYVREGSFTESKEARRLAFSLALALEDADTLRLLCADSRWLSEMKSESVTHAARLIGDRWLLLRAIAQYQWKRWSQTLEMPLALLAAGVWYLLLVYTGSGERWRWIRYLSPVLAGVMSVWLLEWWMESYQYGMDSDDQKTMGHEIIQWVMYVGVPEESVKLALFALFLPLLLRQGSASKAALTAGCVGLGFAFDENLGYFLHEGGQVAIGRLITANFLHVTLTGVVGSALYQLVRSRFHRAAEFIVAYFGVCVAHGVYDFATTSSAQKLGIDLAGIIVIAVMARIYLDLLRPEDGELRRRTISVTSVFCTGSALLIACTIMVTVWQENSMSGATEALKSVIAVFPVALIYIREFREL